MSSEFRLFQTDILTFKEKFYILIDLLLSNQTPSRIESIIFLGISYTQIISGFFDEKIGVFNKNKSTSDKILYYIEKILRFKDFLINKYTEFKICIIILFLLMIFFIIFFIITCSKIKKDSFYSYNECFINYFIKCFIYIFFNIILDLIIVNFCFGKDEKNQFFQNISCQFNDNIYIKLISIVFLFISISLIFFIQIFYSESFYLSNSFYSRISCNYEIYITLNSIFFSILLVQVKYLSKEIFLLFNLISSGLLFYFYLTHYIFYDKITNNLIGLFLLLYFWTSFFCIIFKYLDFNEKGILYMASCILIIYSFFSLKYKIVEKLFFEIPFYKITNKNYFLYYIKNLIDRINHIDNNPEEKALLGAIMYMHSIECPNFECVSKNKNRLYLPITNEWSDRTKPNVDDKVFLINFVIIIMSYVISQNYYSPDMVINLSLYYIDIIGNYCLAIFYYKKVKEMRLTFQQRASFQRLKLKLSKALIEKLKGPNEQVTSIEDLNVTMYFKYEDLSQTFIDEINIDISLSLDFWKIFRNSQLDYNKQIDFNYLFCLTDKIRITKSKIEKIWDKLLSIYNGVNDLFDLYSEYVEKLNDDDLKKRDLENFKRKNDTFSEHLSQNYYVMLFNKDTGIIIANGDKGKEGIIEKTNLEIENIFKYKTDELKGMNLSTLMPKNYSRIHSSFIERYYHIGEKIIIDKKNLKTFGKDKNNTIILLKILIKLFPMLNENVYFIGILVKENIDDIIYIDDKFNIQGMSMKLMKKLNIDNFLLFQNNDIPFYVICKKFINFYKIFLQGKKQNVTEKEKRQSILIESGLSESNNIEEVKKKKAFYNIDSEKNEFHENIEINENVELEYEICLPQFLIDYLKQTNKVEKKEIDKEIEKERMLENRMEINEISNDGIELFEENDSLIENDSPKKFRSKKDLYNVQNNNNANETIYNNTNITPTPNDTPKYTQIPNSYSHIVAKIGKSLYHNNNNNFNFNVNNAINQSRIDFSKLTDEEKEFNGKIERYKELFHSGKFNELDDLIDNCNLKTMDKEYKFNFTFEKYRFGRKNISYIIRCIDNKNDYLKSEEESFEINETKVIQYKKEKMESIKPLFEIIEEEKKKIINQTQNFFNLSIENENFQNLLNLCKEDINRMSMVHGMKKDEIQDDENASQASQVGFNSDLVKKNRIEEIRANILNNISNFYTLKYIKILVLLISLSTILFTVIYLIFFFEVYENIIMSNRLNLKLFQSTIWMTNLIGTLISLRSLFYNVNINQDFDFNSFIEDKYEYFTFLRKISFRWYNNITLKFGEFENQICKFLDKKKQKLYFWDIENVSYYYKNFNYDKETFPMGLSQIISDINSLLVNKNFDLYTNISDQNIYNYFQHISFIAIENTYDNLIPNLFFKLSNIPKFFQTYNNSSKKILIILLLIYSGLMFIFSIIYSILLHLTNENMSEGLEKVTKIKLDKIEETIKKIESFNFNLKRFIEKDYHLVNTNDNEKSNFESTKLQNTGIQDLNEIASSNSFNNETKKIIPLKILSFSYIQIIILFLILCLFLIPIYIVTNSMVISANKLIDFENYIFGRILKSGIKILNLKCNISECDVNNELIFIELININQIQKIIKGINLFNDLNIFYNEYFLLNACKSAFLDNKIEYDECMNNQIIISANNTDSLLQFTEEMVETINVSKILNENNDFYTLRNGEIVKFKSIYLYETESFKELEEIFYKYITPVSDNFSNICINNFLDYVFKKKTIIILLYILFNIMVIILCFYIALCFVKQLIHLISVSRCILKIIPTIVINNTPELENWIENKY